MSKEELVLRSVDIDKDAQKLADMWNASDDQWPGTFTEGVPMTATRAKEDFERERAVDRLIWDAGDEIAGYCSLWEWMDEPNVTYIALLNVAPKYQKQSLARKFLTHYVDRVIELGSVRLDLHTWPGNLPAVPLYKKCGFFWMPNSSVHMLNFMPSILQMECAKPFFAKHNWYRSFKRELAQTEDDERWEGMKVFTYRFEEGGDSLTVWADRESRTITAVETDEYLAACIAEEIAPAKGLPTPLKWRFTNKSDKPLQISVIASGSEHLKIDYRTNLEVGPGETSEVTSDVKVAVDTPAPKSWKPMPSIKSVALINGTVVELATGLRPREAVEVMTDPYHLTLSPGVSKSVAVNLRNRTKEAVTATVSIAASDVTTSWGAKKIELAPEGWGGAELSIESKEPGAYEVPVSVEVDHPKDKILQPPKPQLVLVAEPGSLTVGKGDDFVRTENSHFRVTVGKGGAFNIQDFKTRGGSSLSGYPIPPERPNEFDDASDFEIGFDRTADEVVLYAKYDSKKVPGLSLHRRLRVTASPVARLDIELVNSSTESLRYQLRRGTWAGGRLRTLHINNELVQGFSSDFPGSQDDEQRKASYYTEQWAALESNESTFGVIWSKDVEEVSSGGFRTTTAFFDLPPQSRYAPEPIHVYYGPGDWRQVRQIWQELNGVEFDREAPAEVPKDVVTVELDPAVPVSSSDRLEAKLSVHHRLARPTAATITTRPPSGDPQTFEAEAIDWKTPFTADLALDLSGRAGPRIVKGELRADDLDKEYDLVAFRLAGNGEVKIGESVEDGQKIITLSNGLMEVDVTPDFAGSISAIREGGANHLLTAFPNVATLGWMSPWHGGVTPFLITEGDFPGKLYREKFDSQDLTVDVAGHAWRGVRLRSDLTTEDYEGLAVEIDVATLPESPILRYCMRVINLTNAARHFYSGPAIFIQPDGDKSSTLLISGERDLKPSDRYNFGVDAGSWAAGVNPETGRALVCVSTGREVSYMSLGREGQHLLHGHSSTAKAGTALERVCYFAVAENKEECAAYDRLKLLG